MKTEPKKDLDTRLPEALSQVSIPIVPVVQRNGLVRMMDRDTGICVGIAARPEVAERTRRFFS